MMYELTDEEWEKLKVLLPTTKGKGGRPCLCAELMSFATKRRFQGDTRRIEQKKDSPIDGSVFPDV